MRLGQLHASRLQRLSPLATLRGLTAGETRGPSALPNGRRRPVAALPDQPGTCGDRQKAAVGALRAGCTFGGIALQAGKDLASLHRYPAFVPTQLGELAHFSVSSAMNLAKVALD